MLLSIFQKLLIEFLNMYLPISKWWDRGYLDDKKCLNILTLESFQASNLTQCRFIHFSTNTAVTIEVNGKFSNILRTHMVSLPSSLKGKSPNQLDSFVLRCCWLTDEKLMNFSAMRIMNMLCFLAIFPWVKLIIVSGGQEARYFTS